MTLMNCATIILVFTLPPYILACGGGSSYDDENDGNDDKGDIEDNASMEISSDWMNNITGNGKDKDPMASNLLHHGWTPSPQEMQQWNDWFNKYKAHLNQSNIDIVDPSNILEFDNERGPGSGWPSGWADAGAGFGGAPPPPWAYAPKNTGKPGYCFLPPRVGVCLPPRDFSKFTTPVPSLRFAYHPYKDECVPFMYSGCSGNRNNFYDKKKCEQRCVALVPFNGCDVESHIYIDDIINNN